MGSKSGSSKSVGSSLVKSVEKMLPKGVDLTTLVLVLVVLGIAYFIMTNMDADKVEGLAPGTDLDASNYYCDDGSVQTCTDSDASNNSNVQCANSGDIYCGDGTGSSADPQQRIESEGECNAGQCAADLTCVGGNGVQVSDGNSGNCLSASVIANLQTAADAAATAEEETRNLQEAINAGNLTSYGSGRNDGQCNVNIDGDNGETSSLSLPIPSTDAGICEGLGTCDLATSEGQCVAPCTWTKCTEIGDDDVVFDIAGANYIRFNKCMTNTINNSVLEDKQKYLNALQESSNVNIIPGQLRGTGTLNADCSDNFLTLIGGKDANGPTITSGLLPKKFEDRVKDVYKKCNDRWSDFDSSTYEANGGYPILGYDSEHGLVCRNSLNKVEQVELGEPRFIKSESCPGDEGTCRICLTRHITGDRKFNSDQNNLEKAGEYVSQGLNLKEGSYCLTPGGDNSPFYECPVTFTSNTLNKIYENTKGVIPEFDLQPLDPCSVSAE